MDNEEFLQLLIKELTGNITAAEQKILQGILTGDSVYKKQYDFLKHYWEGNNGLNTDDTVAFKKILLRIKNNDTPVEPATADDAGYKPRPMFIFWRSIAAVLLIGIGAWLFYVIYNSNSDANMQTDTWQVKSTSRRIKSIIYLADGTKITLNSESTLKYPTAFNGKTREVYLSGEAFFDVAKDHQHPFIIHTGKMNVRVLGTAFNVKSYPNERNIETTLIRGSILVTLADRPLDNIILKPKEKLIVRNPLFKDKAPGFKAAIPEKDNSTKYTLTSLTYYAKSDTSVVETSWAQNKLMFSNEEFADLAVKMERWYGYDISFADDNLKHLRFTATFERETVKEALFALQRTEHFNYKIDRGTITIY